MNLDSLWLKGTTVTRHQFHLLGRAIRHHSVLKWVELFMIDSDLHYADFFNCAFHLNILHMVTLRKPLPAELYLVGKLVKASSCVLKDLHLEDASTGGSLFSCLNNKLQVVFSET